MYPLRTKGFTLIELLVVISIIGVLSSTVLASLSTARAKALDTRRLSDLTSIRTALELYYTNNNSYPSSAAWRSECATWGSYTNDQVIPGLTPTNISKFPSDPQMNKAGSTCCYLYRSTGADYKVMAYNCPTSPMCQANTPPGTGGFRDPVYDKTCSIYTPGGSGL
jgi:prepilin-type N-terminal cleavage/methylation domain-containing protein